MKPADQEPRLSVIQTLWTLVRQARDEAAEVGPEARRELLERYGEAVRRYLRGALRDLDAADELAQEFNLRLLRGDFDGADPQRGRFRSFLKGVLSHLVADYHRSKARRPRRLSAAVPEPAARDSEPVDPDRPSLECRRQQLLDRAWLALAELQGQTGQPFSTVLRCRVEHPDKCSADLAEQLTVMLGKPVTAAWVRQTLHRAREKFADLLVAEVRKALNNPTTVRLEDELGDLGLLDYCRPALDRPGRTG